MTGGPAGGVPWGAWPLVRPVAGYRPWLLGALYAACLLPMTLAPRHSGNVFSRYMTIEAIVERGTLAIERSPLLVPSGSPDVVKFGPHLYSDKPPSLPALASPIYAGLYLAGIRFAGGGSSFAASNLAMTWGVVGLASAWAVASIRRLLQAVAIPPRAADLLALGAGFGTQLLTYAVTFNNHSVGAALILAGLGRTVLERAGPGAGRSRFLAGLYAGLASTIDLPAGGLILAGLGALQATRARGVPWAYLAGAAGPLLLHAGLQSLVTGSPLPSEMYPESFLFPGSYWATPEGTWHERGPRWRFGLGLLVGPGGWLTITPALVFGLAGLAMTLARRGDPLRPAAWVVAGSAAGLLAYYTWGVRRTDFGGSSFGVRHLLPITPPCLVFGAVALGRLRGWAAPILFVALAGVGAAYAIAGMKDPWSRVERRERSEPALHSLQHLVPYRPEGPPR